jgi:hypothetical protein
MTINKFLSLSLLGFLLFSCSEKNLSYDYPQDPSYVRKSRAGKFFGKNNSDIVIYGGKERPAKKALKTATTESQKN